jgi:NADH-quinone oxidoreductase subunit C
VTVQLNGEEIGKKIANMFPQAVTGMDKTSVIVESKSLYNIAKYLKDTDEFDFNYLANLTSVDYMDYFEVVYNLVSLNLNHSVTLKTRCYDRKKPEVPSVTNLWRTADYQEREIFDLMGICFSGHPNMKRLFLWEGFEGHPLRRDYL